MDANGSNDGANPWALGRQGTLAALVEQRILALINSRQLHPGGRLPSERQLAELLGVSRPPLREALSSLRARGILDVRHGAGIFIADAGSGRDLRQALLAEEVSIRELFEMREALEAPAAAWAARNPDSTHLDSISDAFDRLNAASARREPDWDRLRELDTEFHLRIIEAAGNRFMLKTLEVLNEMLRKGMETTLRWPGRLEASRQEHGLIVKAILAHNVTAARRATATHIHGAQRVALERLRDDTQLSTNHHHRR
jgi:GntR family transcriptional regulator, transcriptional repressor for pyruvate dehydrogenase complex